MQESGSRPGRARALGVVCALFLAAVIGLSLYSMRRTLPPALSFMLWPGVAADTLASGRAGYEMSPESTAFFNIGIWSVALIGAAALWLSPRAPHVSESPRQLEEALVPVYMVANPAELPVVESLLTEAGIPYTVRNEATQRLVGDGQFGGSNIVAPLEVWVGTTDADTARELLSAGTLPPGQSSAT